MSRQIGATPQGGRFIQSSGVSATNPEPSVMRPADPPYSAADLPTEVNGVKVKHFEMDEPVETAFSRSQIAELTKQGRYAENRDKILNAVSKGLVRDDVTDPSIIEARRKAAIKEAEPWQHRVDLRHAKEALNQKLKEFQAAEAELEIAERSNDPYAVLGPQKKKLDASKAFDDAVAALKALEAKK